MRAEGQRESGAIVVCLIADVKSRAWLIHSTECCNISSVLYALYSEVLYSVVFSRFRVSTLKLCALFLVVCVVYFIVIVGFVNRFSTICYQSLRCKHGRRCERFPRHDSSKLIELCRLRRWNIFSS